MPLIVKDFNWNQTERTVTIEVPLHGVPSNKVDIFTSDQYIKASYPPNFFDTLLSHPVNAKQSSCILTEDSIVFELQKRDYVNWETLEKDVPKSERQSLKNALIAAEHERIQLEAAERSELRCSLQKLAVKEAIRLDTKQRETIEKVKNEEKNKALSEFGSWNDDQLEINRKRMKARSLTKSRCFASVRPLERRPIPSIRPTRVLEVSFTPRLLPTPIRESRLEEEGEWLMKQAAARRSVGFVSEDLRPEEKNPVFLKAKGDEFMKQGNYLAAISAYTFGISLSNQYADLYVRRSEAQYLQGNLKRAIEDCSDALELMVPAVDGNFEQRAECIRRRGLSLIKIGLYKEARGELEAALKMKPDDVILQHAFMKAEEFCDESD